MDELRERVNPIRVTDNETGEVYTLDFNRDAIITMERDEFDVDDVVKYPKTNFPKFFYYATRMYHKRLSRGQTDKLYEAIGGMTEEFLQRLHLLYNQAVMAGTFQDKEDLEKNTRVTVEF